MIVHMDKLEFFFRQQFTGMLLVFMQVDVDLGLSLWMLWVEFGLVMFSSKVR